MTLYKLRKPTIDAFVWTGRVEDSPKWFQEIIEKGDCAIIDPEDGELWIDEGGDIETSRESTCVLPGDYVYIDHYIYDGAVTFDLERSFHERWEPVPDEDDEE